MFTSLITGGLTWWLPTFYQFGIYSNNEIPDQISLKFGIIGCLTGFVSVFLALTLSTK